jgi:hypothetical protein
MRSWWPILTLVVSSIGMQSAAAYDDKDIQSARKLCVRNFGGTAEFYRIDEVGGYIYCRDSWEVVRIPYRKKKPAKPRSNEAISANDASGVDPNDGRNEPCRTSTDCSRKVEQESLPPATSNNAPIDPTAVEVPTTIPQSPKVSSPEANERLLDQAKSVCVSQYGPTSTVDHIDYSNWHVVCKKP